MWSSLTRTDYESMLLNKANGRRATASIYSPLALEYMMTWMPAVALGPVQ